MNKEQEIAKDTLDWLENPQYSIDGKHFNLASDIDYCVNSTNTLVNKADHIPPRVEEPKIEFTQESVLEAAYRVRDQNTCLLNFANATTPGGGWKRGAKAQEESIIRSSALYPSIQESRFYDIHKAKPLDFLYTDAVIYSPRVPIIKNDAGEYVEPYFSSVLTCAAPMRKSIEALDDPDPEELDDILDEVICKRIEKILGVIGSFEHDTVILGGWGCGAFGNDPCMVSDAFKAKLEKMQFFKHVIFAFHSDTLNKEIFEEAFQ